MDWEESIVTIRHRRTDGETYERSYRLAPDSQVRKVALTVHEDGRLSLALGLDPDRSEPDPYSTAARDSLIEAGFFDRLD